MPTAVFYYQQQHGGRLDATPRAKCMLARKGSESVRGNMQV